MRYLSNNSYQSRAGFTLIEILVVLVIAAVLAAVTLGGYSAMRSSNARTSCQANMAQIYKVIRLYASDYNGEVPYYDPDNTLGNGTGIGLWSLYTFPQDSSTTTQYTKLGGDFVKPADANIKPEKRYLSNPKLFHCPADIADTSEQMFTDSANSVYNPNYLSYQTTDTGCEDPSATGCGPLEGEYATPQFTYNPIQTNDVSDGADWQRQLLTFDGSNLISRPPTDDTVVLWCPFHRGHGSASFDNVLFWDGTVQGLPVRQSVTTPPTFNSTVCGSPVTSVRCGAERKPQ